MASSWGFPERNKGVDEVQQVTSSSRVWSGWLAVSYSITEGRPERLPASGPSGGVGQLVLLWVGPRKDISRCAGEPEAREETRGTSTASKWVKLHGGIYGLQR
jgi:hypothetical protein